LPGPHCARPQQHCEARQFACLRPSTSAAVDELKYGYDQDSNVSDEQNKVTTNQSSVFTDDSLNRLASYNRGLITVSGGSAKLPSNIASGTWSLDAVGNWDSSSINGSSTSRTNSAQNQITTDGSATLAYDNNGNTTTDQNGSTYVYDPWNRLVKVTSINGTVLANYGYDALGERITETDSGSPTTDLYYSAQWQVLQEQQGALVTDEEVWSPI
jgi:YD repeat-containing protein